MTERAGRKAVVLLVDDDDEARELLAQVLTQSGYEVREVDDGSHAVALAGTRHGLDAVVSDVQMPVAGGFDVLDAFRRAGDGVPIVLMTAFGDVDAAMRAVDKGAYDYVTKPLDVRKLRATLEHAIERARLGETRARPDGRPHRAGAVVAHAAPMIELYKTIAQIAPSSITVLVIGESGCGKELVARTVHARSTRAAGPFVAVNCAALPETLLESELFGHVRGAFTGAVSDRRGLFEEATNGTLFLDEIGHVSPKMQGELLRVLQEGEIRRVGGGPVKVDVRVIGATNRDLEPLVATGQFRSDLYYRLNVVTLRVPPLRDRKEDIPPLVAHFLAIAADRAGIGVPPVAPDALAALCAYAWPGNVRELENVVQRALAVARPGGIVEDDLPDEVRAGPKPPPLPQAVSAEDWPTLDELTRRYVGRVLERTGGNRTRAAEILGVDRRTLSRMANRERGRDDDDDDGATS